METRALIRGLNGIPHELLEFAYDYIGRRVQKRVYSYSGSWVLQSTRKFVWEDWTLVAELEGSNGLVRSYSWSGNQLLGLTDGGSDTTYLAVSN